MSEDSDKEIPEFDIESRNWNKMQENMKLIGFREGALKGRDLSFQEGFDLGYTDGFKLGEFLGQINGAIRCQSELGFISSEKFESDCKTYSNLSSNSCILCSQKSTSATAVQSEQTTPENFNDFLLSLQSHVVEVIEEFKKSDLKLYFEKG